jgi:hypothetical protein
MIIVSATKRTVRETTAPYEFTDEDGNPKTEDVRVQYYSLTIKDIKADQDEIKAKAKKDPNGTYWLSDELAKRIHALPDLADEDGKPFPITAKSLEECVAVTNLRSIKAAIEKDIAPKEQPGK